MLDRMIPLEQAAKILKVKSSVLKRMVESGKMEAVNYMGVILVKMSETEIPDGMPTREQFNHLNGDSITVTEASEKYSVHRDTILGWIKYGHIRVITPGYRQQINEGDMAYYAAVYHARGGGRGVRVLDQAGRPYIPKNPDRARYQREYKRAYRKRKSKK